MTFKVNLEDNVEKLTLKYGILAQFTRHLYNQNHGNW